MTFRTLVAAALLSLAPGLALAGGGGCGFDHMKEQVSSCADGYVWDSAAATCVPKATS